MEIFFATTRICWRLASHGRFEDLYFCFKKDSMVEVEHKKYNSVSHRFLATPGASILSCGSFHTKIRWTFSVLIACSAISAAASATDADILSADLASTAAFAFKAHDPRLQRQSQQQKPPHPAQALSRSLFPRPATSKLPLPGTHHGALKS